MDNFLYLIKYMIPVLALIVIGIIYIIHGNNKFEREMRKNYEKQSREVNNEGNFKKSRRKIIAPGILNGIYSSFTTESRNQRFSQSTRFKPSYSTINRRNKKSKQIERNKVKNFSRSNNNIVSCQNLMISKEYFKSHNMNFKEQGDKIKVTIPTTNKNLFSNYDLIELVYENYIIFFVYFNSRVTTPDDKKKIMEICTRINSSLLLGNFEFDVDICRYKLSEDCSNNLINEKKLDEIIEYCTDVYNTYNSLFDEAIKKELSVDEALNHFNNAVV